VENAFIYTHWPTLGMGVLAFAIMYGLRRISPKIPNVLVAVVVTTLISWMIGFQHDTTVDVSAIESPEVKQYIKNFNEAIAVLPRLGDERVELGKALDEAKEKKDYKGVLDVEHDVSVVNLQTERAKHDAHVCRERLRKDLFVRQKFEDGSYKFYLKGAVPPGVEGDGRTWRLKVGNKLLDEGQLLMMGGGAVVGVIPKGLPSLTIPKIDLKVVLQLLPFAVIISILGFMEAISIAKAMAAKTGQRLDPNQELIGQGLGNIIGSIGKSYPVSGSFSRSAVNLQAGAVTGFSSVVTTVTVVIVLLFFTPLLYHLPQAVLAAVIMMAVIGLINVSGFMHAWRAQWYDGAISIISFVATLAFAPHLDKGIMIGVVLSLGMFLYKSMRPTVARLSKAEDDAHRDSLIHGLEECKYIAMVRFDGPLFFANASYLEDCVAEIRLAKKKLKHIILVSNGINDIDASGEEALSLLVDRVRSAGIEMSFSGINESVMKVLKRTHLLAKIGEQNIFPTTEKAVCAIHERAHRGGDEKTCPLTAVCRIS
jgi:SulP family sulfate permease